MPVSRPYTIKEGSTSKSLFVVARDARDRSAPKTGLSAGTDGARAAYAREGDPKATEVRLVDGAAGGHVPGGFVEIDRDLLPGVYQFDLPDAALAPGAARLLVYLRFPETIVDPIAVDIVAFDPLDAERIGMEGLGARRRHEFLRRALPRLTERELELGTEAERRLAAQSDASASSED